VANKIEKYEETNTVAPGISFLTLGITILFSMPLARVERTTFPLGRDCSIQLSYRGKTFNLG